MIRDNNIKLGEVAEFRNGVNYNENNFGTGIKIINVANFKDYSKPNYEELSEINPNDLIKEDDLLQNGDIVFVRSNGNKNLIGRTLYIDEIENDLTYSAFCIRARFTSKECNPRFYAYLFKTNLIRQILSSQGNGTNISNLNQKILNNLVVPKPSMKKQNKIVSILSKYDDLIENNTNRIKLLEESIDLIYKEWFVNLRFPEYENSEIIDGIPKEWNKTELGEFFPIITGKKNANISCDRGKYKFFTCAQQASQCNEYSFEDTAILLAGNGEFNVKYYSGKFEAYQRTYVLITYNKEYNLYLYQCIKYSLPQMTNGSKGSVIKYLTKDMINNFIVYKPDMLTIEKFNKLATPIFDQITALQIENEKLKEARDILIPRLISGEIEV